VAVDVKADDIDMLNKIAMTSMSSKVVSGSKEKLAEIAVKAVLEVKQEVDGRTVVDIDDIKLEKKVGGSIEDTQLIYGIVLDKEVVHPDMPKSIKDAKIALIQSPLEVEKTEFDAEIRITNPDQMFEFKQKEENLLKEMVEKISATGANVVFCQKGILAVRRVKKSDMEKLSKATGARIITNFDDISEKDLGYAKLVEERKVADDKMVFVEGCKNPKAVSILVRGGTERIVDEAERAIHDAICVVRNVIEDKTIVAGGGAPEIEVSKRLKRLSEKFTGKEQLAALKFAEALEVIPRTLAENAGMDPIDIVTQMIAEHENGKLWVGVDIYEEKVDDMKEKRVFEPLRTKKQAIKSASEAATMILRIDDIIVSKKEETKGPKGPEEGGMSGVGGPGSY